MSITETQEIKQGGVRNYMYLTLSLGGVGDSFCRMKSLEVADMIK